MADEQEKGSHVNLKRALTAIQRLSVDEKDAVLRFAKMVRQRQCVALRSVRGSAFPFASFLGTLTRGFCPGDVTSARLSGWRAEPAPPEGQAAARATQ